MGKKKPEEMAKQRDSSSRAATERKLPAEQGRADLRLLEKFAGYGFNKSHSAAYGWSRIRPRI